MMTPEERAHALVMTPHRRCICAACEEAIAAAIREAQREQAEKDVKVIESLTFLRPDLYYCVEQLRESQHELNKD